MAIDRWRAYARFVRLQWFIVVLGCAVALEVSTCASALQDSLFRRARSAFVRRAPRCLPSRDDAIRAAVLEHVMAFGRVVPPVYAPGATCMEVHPRGGRVSVRLREPNADDWGPIVGGVDLVDVDTALSTFPPEWRATPTYRVMMHESDGSTEYFVKDVGGDFVVVRTGGVFCPGF